MRVNLGLLLLLLALCGSGAQGEDGGLGEESTKHTTKQTTPDIWVEVRALRDIVMEQRVELRNMEVRVKESKSQVNELRAELIATKAHVERLQRENSVQETKLNGTESKTSDLEKANAVLTAELTYVKTRLTATEKKTSDLEKENAALQARLSSSENEMLVAKSQIDHLDRENAGLGARLTRNEREVVLSKSRIDQLERKNAEEPKVAFYAALTDVGNVGPYETDVTLKYSKVFTNTGNAYNSTTGVFTAPANGVYYFQFTACGYQTGVMGVYLYKNNQRMMYNGEWKKDVDLEYLTNSVVFELRAGDEIHLVLPSDFSVYDDGSNQSTFTGALLFPL